MTTEAPVIDEAKSAEFLFKAFEDIAGTMTVLLCAIGDRLGLFSALEAAGPVNSEAFAQRANINERYAREWLGAMAAAGYIDYDPATETFSLPAEHAEVLARENAPYFFGGFYEMLGGLSAVLDPLVEAFRVGGGVPQSAYPPTTWSGMERGSATWVDNALVQTFFASVPEVIASLERGVDFADVGCGSGRALIRLAQAYPNSRFVGIDLFEAQVKRATANVASAGLADKVTIVQADASKGLPGTYDMVSTFDVVHDSADPPALMSSIRQSLRPDGYFLCLDINCSDKLEENIGAFGTMFHGFSVLYCMTTSLAQGGAGLGTVGLHEPKIRELASEAGFSSVERAPFDNPFNVLWVLRP